MVSHFFLDLLYLIYLDVCPFLKHGLELLSQHNTLGEIKPRDWPYRLKLEITPDAKSSLSTSQTS